MFAGASALDGLNAVVSVSEMAILWRHCGVEDHAKSASSACDALQEVPLQALPSWSSVERALEWADVSPVMVYAGPVLAVAATLTAIAGEVLAQVRHEHSAGDGSDNTSHRPLPDSRNDDNVEVH